MSDKGKLLELTQTKKNEGVQLSIHQPVGSTNKYVQQFDAVPEFWQHLKGLRSIDLIAELIQNELDANASHTNIIFNIQEMTCHGDGETVDEDGWKRLSYITGAGNLVPRKRNSIGVKNHGLKACFLIGDDINVRSNYKFINQTLYKDGLSAHPSPGTYKYPYPDETAPQKGCFIEVPYRIKKLVVNVGEPLDLSPPSEEMIEDLFLQACRDMPQRFIASLRPGIREHYIIDLTHHRLGTARFTFNCGRQRSFQSFKLYNRTCKVSGNIQDLPDELRENCVLFTIKIPQDSNREIPEFYKARGRRFFSEISWRIDKRGRPCVTSGCRRYPIEYGPNGTLASTGVGVNFSGPYISDLERRGRTEESQFNDLIDDICKSILIKFLRDKLIPQHGAKALELIINPVNQDDDVLQDMIERALKFRSLPIANRIGPIKIRKNPKGLKKGRKLLHFGPRPKSTGEVKRIVSPVFTWEKDKISTFLAELCPNSEDQIDPTVPGPILRLLAENNCEGWNFNHINFGENDAIDRFQPTRDTNYFPWMSEKSWRDSLGDPHIACLYLDVVMAVDKSAENFTDDDLAELKKDAYLPDSSCSAIPVVELYSGVNLPVGLPVRDMPSILHPKLAKHRIFKKKTWKLPHFTFSQFINKADIEHMDKKTRKSFWNWLRVNWKSVPRSDLTRIAQLPVWPDKSGSLVSLSELCEPHTKSIGTILKDVLHRPNSQVFEIGHVKKAKRGKLSVRAKPEYAEVLDFLQAGLAKLPRDRALSYEERKEFHKLEKELATLSQVSSIRIHLENCREKAIALDGNGYLCHVEELVRVDRQNKNLWLPNEYIIDRQMGALDHVDGWGPKPFPSTDQILKTLEHDAHRKSALLPRLQAYLKAAKQEDENMPLKDRIVDIKCIPHDDTFRSPGELAFKGSHGDYWGSWKHRISGKGLSADVQKVYRLIGVLGGEPSTENSLAFFKWLNKQKQSAISDHMACIIRHINHYNGPVSWWDEYPECPCIPVKMINGGLELCSRVAATNQRSMVVIPDFEVLVEAISIEPASPSIKLAILSHPSVNTPITERLRQIGVRSLRSRAGDPISVYGEKGHAAPQRILSELKKLRSELMSRQLKKRLDEREIDTNKCRLRNHWKDRLDMINGINIAPAVTATFNIFRCRYTLQMNEAIDKQTGIIWLTDCNENMEDMFYQAVTELIFEDPPKYLPSVLKDAVRCEFREDVIHVTEQNVIYEDDIDERNDFYYENEKGDEPGATGQTHHGSQPDRKKNIPKSGNIPIHIAATQGAHKASGKGQEYGTSLDSAREASRLEDVQRRDLKENQYAWHCQICLAAHTTEQLAPVDSYVDIAENRSAVMKAHHPDQVDPGGARHAGNMLILCNYHHKLIGDALSRQDVTDALRGSMQGYEIVFKSHVDGKLLEKTVLGKVVSIDIPLTGETIRCFFTNSHAKYWIEKASI